MGDNAHRHYELVLLDRGALIRNWPYQWSLVKARAIFNAPCWNNTGYPIYEEEKKMAKLKTLLEYLIVAN